jgi:geranylgeranyl pyrophosphate synthase
MYSLTIEQRLSELIPNRQEPLFQAARYSLLAPGKRLRPKLVLETAISLGGTLEAAIDPASAIEMIHTYSLIHDDLPCMDDDDLRRGLPSLHKVFGEGMALLAGDYLLTYSFEVLSSAPFLTLEQRIDLIQTLSRRAGSFGMIGGQAIDIASEGKLIDEVLLEKMHVGKTAELLSACLEFGAIVAGADGERRVLSEIGKEIGLAYQILDDILDATSTTGHLGKQVGADAARGKPTAVSLYGLEGAQDKLESLKSRAFQKLEPFPVSLKELLKKLLQRNK